MMGPRLEPEDGRASSWGRKRSHGSFILESASDRLQRVGIGPLITWIEHLPGSDRANLMLGEPPNIRFGARQTVRSMQPHALNARDPASSEVWSSLGEAFARHADYLPAFLCFRAAVSLMELRRQASLAELHGFGTLVARLRAGCAGLLRFAGPWVTRLEDDASRIARQAAAVVNGLSAVAKRDESVRRELQEIPDEILAELDANNSLRRAVTF